MKSYLKPTLHSALSHETDDRIMMRFVWKMKTSDGNSGTFMLASLRLGLLILVPLMLMLTVAKMMVNLLA
eukprot:6027325-Karenia_brevis.AAC.1